MTKKMIVENFATAEEFFVHWPAVARLADRGEQIARAAIWVEQLKRRALNANAVAGKRRDIKVMEMPDALSLEQRLAKFDPVRHGGEVMMNSVSLRLDSIE